MKTLVTKKLCKSYSEANSSLQVLNDVNIEIESGSSSAIVGTSGSGKSTLLSLLAGLDTPSSGEVLLDNERIDTLSEDELSEIRKHKIGFIFQQFYLIPSLTALENVMIPLELLDKKEAKEKAQELLKRVGLEDKGHHYPNQLSGGEQQRVAIARSLVHSPKLLFADEPTGNLDDKNSRAVFKLLIDLQKEQSLTLILVTHDMDLARKMDVIYEISKGNIHKQKKK